MNLEKLRKTLGLPGNAARAALLEYEERLLREPRYQQKKNLNCHEHKVFSQFGEDGIIAEIFNRIGTTDKTFLEVGVGDGLENNTAFLLLLGWSGYWVEGNPKSISQIQVNVKPALTRLRLKEAFVTAENIQGLLDEMGVPQEPDLLSLDIDRNTFYVWKSMRVRPRVAVIEYNSQIPKSIDWKVEYNPTRVWNETLYMGASLKALENLGRELGYSLVGCSISGANAFFVRNDLCSDHFEEPFTAEHHFQPPRYFLQRITGHPPCFHDEN